MSRIKNVIKNAKVGLFFMVITFALGMVSRKIFLDQLGPEFIGLTTTLLGIIGFLSLAEMGLSVAVSSTLYKPLAEKNYQQIITTIDFLGKAYKAIGVSIIILATIVALFLPYFFPNKEINLQVVYFAYLVFVVSVVIEYIFNYKQIILSADQKNYVITYCRDSLNILKVILQIAVIKFGLGEYAWLTIGLVTTSISIYLINRYVSKYYSWLIPTGKTLKQLYRDSYEVVIKTKQLMVHKISFFVFSSSDSILIYKFTSLSTVALIGNYQMISGVFPIITSILRSGLTSSVGNYIHSKQNDVVSLFKIIWVMSWCLALFLGICFYYLIDPFVFMWLGGGYEINHSVVIIIFANMMLMMTRGVIDIFINAYGIFHDLKAPVIEVFINIICSVILGIKYGAVGVLIGTFASVFIVIFLWKPYFLYGLKFKIPYSNYLIMILKLFIVACVFFTVDIYFGTIDINVHSWGGLFFHTLYIILYAIFIVLLYGFFHFNEIKYLIKRYMLKIN